MLLTRENSGDLLATEKSCTFIPNSSGNMLVTADGVAVCFLFQKYIQRHFGSNDDCSSKCFIFRILHDCSNETAGLFR